MNGLQFSSGQAGGGSAGLQQVPVNSPIASPAYDINLVSQLVDTLYNSANSDEQNEANRRLTELQASNEAWNVCWLLLDPNNSYPNEVHFFAANLLALKINQGWSQQDPEWLEAELRPKLFDILIKYSSSSNGTKLVMDRLALALANFALHSIPTFWPDAIEDILNTFTSINPPDQLCRDRLHNVMLKILIFIPEEYSVMIPVQDHRAKLNERITHSGPMVFKFLHSLLVDQNNLANSPDGGQNVFKSLTSWTLHSQTTLLEMEDGKSLLNRLYDLIWNEELCASACSTLAASFASPKAENYRNSIIEFIPKIAELQAAVQKYKAEDEIECLIKIYSLVINFSENHSRLFLKLLLDDGIQLEPQRSNQIKQAIFAIIQIILDCTAAPGIFDLDEKYSEIAFSFWFTFFENFCYYGDSYTDKLCDLFEPLVDSLILILINKAQYPPTVTFHQIWDDDKRDIYRRYRQDLGDSISLVATFPRAKDRILKQLQEQFSNELAQMLQFQPGPGEERPWQRTEAVIFTIKSVCEIVPYDECKYVPKIFEDLAKVPYAESHADLYCTVAEMVSAYSDWLYTHTEHLNTAFTVLFLGVTSPNSYVRLMSTLSLKDMTTECQAVLRPYAPQIVESCTDALVQHGQMLTTNEKCRLMHTIGTTLAVTTVEHAASSLQTLTLPIICDLSTKAQTDPASDETCRPVILDRLAMLNNLLESLYVKQYSGNEFEDCDENDPRLFNTTCYELNIDVEAIQPAIGLLRELIPVLTMIAHKHRTDEDVMDKISDTIRRSSKSLGIELKPIVSELVSLVVNAYDPAFNSLILDGLVPIYLLFKSDKSLRELLRDAFARISDKTLQICMTNPLRQLSMTAENFFKFSTAVCRKIPDFLTELPTPIKIDYMYKLALASLELPEKRTLSEVCNFITLFRQKSMGTEHLHSVFVGHLDQLLNNVFCVFGGQYATPRNAIEPVTDMLFHVTCAPEAKEPLRKIVERNNFPTCHVSSEQKARFISNLVQERNRRKYKDACNDFVLLVRNLNRIT